MIFSLILERHPAFQRQVKAKVEAEFFFLNLNLNLNLRYAWAAEVRSNTMPFLLKFLKKAIDPFSFSIQRDQKFVFVHIHKAGGASHGIAALFQQGFVS